MGYMADDFSPGMPMVDGDEAVEDRSLTEVVCQYCGEGGFHWKKRGDGGWRLFDEEEMLHSCRRVGPSPGPEIYSNKDIQKLSMDAWIETSEGLPPCGLEVIAETSDGFVTSLVRYKPNEGSPTWRSWWDNKYPGTGENRHSLFAVSRWRKMPEKKHGR